MIDDMDHVLPTFNGFGRTLAQADHAGLAFVRIDVV